jgi:hypothetical protein
MSKLQKKPSALKKEHPALQNMKFLIFFYPDPDSENGSGPTDQIESGLNPDPDPKPWSRGCEVENSWLRESVAGDKVSCLGVYFQC